MIYACVYIYLNLCKAFQTFTIPIVNSIMVNKEVVCLVVYVNPTTKEG